MENKISRWKLFKASDRYDLMTMVSDEAVKGTEASGGIADKEVGPYPIRSLWRICDMTGSVFVLGNSPIKTWADVQPGIRIAYDTGLPTRLEDAFAHIAVWAGVEREDCVFVPASDMNYVVDLLLEGKVDIISGSPASAYMFRLAANPNGVHCLERDPAKEPEAARRFLAFYPSLMFGKITSGIMEAQGQLGTMMVYTYGVLPSLDADLACHLAKWLDENLKIIRTWTFVLPIWASNLLRNSAKHFLCRSTRAS